MGLIRYDWRCRSLRLRRRLAYGALALLVAGVSIGPAYPRATAAARPPLNTVLLMTSEPGSLQERVVTDGTVVAWFDTRGALFTYYLAEKRETLLLDGPARRSQLALADGTLVWLERGADGGAALRALRLSGGDVITIASGPGERNSPAIAGSTVVWRDHRNGNWDLYGYDLRRGQEFPLVTDGANQGAVALAADTLVWEDYRAGNWRLRGMRLSERREYAITSGQDDDLAPALDGNDTLVFVRRRANGGFGALIVRDLKTAEERTIVAGHLVLRPTVAGRLIVWEDWRGGRPNLYAFDRESKREFPLTRSEQAYGPAVAGTVVAWLSKGEFTSRVTAIRLDQPLPTDPQDPPTVTDPASRYFPESKHNLGGAFRTFWNANGGLAIFGFPLTEAFEETDATGSKRQVQYFERAKLEADPADPSRISVARLGAEQVRGRTFPPIPAFTDSEDRVYFPQTQHSLGSGFKTFWETQGGLPVFGFPLTEEIEENGRTVQYFERARFEYRPDAAPANQVTLGQLGREALIARGWLPDPTEQRRQR